MTVRPAKTQISLGIRQVWSESSMCIQWIATSKGPKLSSCGQRGLWSDWADVQADMSLRWAHMPFCWICHEAAHIAMMDSLRQQFYPRMRPAGRDRKNLWQPSKGISLSHIWEWSIADIVITDHQDFHQQCPFSRSNNRNKILKKWTEKREREYQCGIRTPGLSSAKEIIPLPCLIP